MLKKSFIFRKYTLIATLTLALLAGCAGAPETKLAAVDQPNQNHVKPLNQPTPMNNNNNNKNSEIEPLDPAKIATVTYCELIKNAAAFDRKIVRVRAVYFNGFERMFFYDERCAAGEAPRAPKNIPAETWIEWDADYSRKDDSEEAKKYRAVRSGERKDATVVGRFYAARDINNTGSGKYQLRVMRVEKISDLAD
jgi:hypothetical protein